MRISDWSSDVCSSDLPFHRLPVHLDVRRMTESVFPRRPDGVGPDDLRMPFPCHTVARQKIQPQRDNLSVNVNARFCNPSWACCILGIGGSRRARASHTCVLPENRLFLRKGGPDRFRTSVQPRSEEHTSELQSLMRISYAVFCLKKKQR